MWKQIYLIYIPENASNFVVWIWGESFSFSLSQFRGLIFSITHLGWTHEPVSIWNAAPTCLSALLKTCKQISFRLNNWYHRLLWLHNKWKEKRRFSYRSIRQTVMEQARFSANTCFMSNRWERNVPMSLGVGDMSKI